MNFPNKCPYCGKDIKRNVIDSKDFYKNRLLELHKCFHCAQTILIVKNKQPNNYSEIIHCYPEPKPMEVPERIKNLSPNAAQAFKDAMRAKNMGLDKLAGAGLRLALEHLAWDYLISVKNCSEDELKKLKLKGLIDKMNCDFYPNVCAELVRKFGNDCIHIRQMLDFSVDEVTEIFNCLCALIDSELTILETNERAKNIKAS